MAYVDYCIAYWSRIYTLQKDIGLLHLLFIYFHVYRPIAEVRSLFSIQTMVCKAYYVHIEVTQAYLLCCNTSISIRHSHGLVMGHKYTVYESDKMMQGKTIIAILLLWN